MKNKKEIDIIQQLEKTNCETYELRFKWGAIKKMNGSDGVYVHTFFGNQYHAVGYHDDIKIIDEFITDAKKWRKT